MQARRVGKWRPPRKGPRGHGPAPRPPPARPPLGPGHRCSPRSGLGFRALFSERPSAVIKARRAGSPASQFSRWDRVPTPPGPVRLGPSQVGHLLPERSLEGAALGLLLHSLIFPKLRLLAR